MKISHFLLFISLFSFIFTSCNKKNGTQSDNDKGDSIVALNDTIGVEISKDTSKIAVDLQQHLYDIYSKVLSSYDTDILANSNVLEHLYKNAQTSSLNKLIALADKKSDKVEESWIDFDYWIDAQDFDHPMVVEANITESNDSIAEGYVLVDIFGGKHPVQPRKIGVVLANEDGKWLIDDLFIEYPDDDEVFDLRESIAEWLKN